jgi:predicted O-methyltransferase YrrM
MAVLQIFPDQGQFMKLIVSLLGARKILEIGTFTGYSAMCMAMALPPDGNLVSCDINKDCTEVAKRHWRNAGLDQLIELRLAPALETLDNLLAAGEEGSYDLVFIDADKGNYIAYYEAALRLLRSGGLVLLDNTLWKGKVADDLEQDPDTTALRAVNVHIYSDERVDSSIVPIGDGLTFVRKH